ncbi:AraC family transcriptional regulator [Clostridium gelidum]|uniref:AraC family transcriptional regulator n=2 Tax=Clostridium gelidum TaxID=704125 RepID=A0ABM7TAI5_9CLOT|nr:AraC family transcriptional regulator [Clostridium gelidum]
MEFKHELVKRNEDISVMFLNMTDNARIIPKHWHNHMEIIYILDGYLEVDINNSSYLVEENQLIVISPRDIHSTAHKDSNTSILLQIPYELLENNIDDVQNIHFECNPYMKNNQHIDCQNDIKILLKSFAEIYKYRPLGYKLKINSLIYDLLFILVNKFSVSVPKLNIQKTDRYLDRLELITKYVKKHYKECISLDDISAQARLNPEYFSRFFKKYMGTTFLKYLNSIRLEHFYTNLTNTDYSITELIEKNGFTNYKMFMKLFKDNYGCTPSETRKIILKNNIKNSKM